MAFRRKIYDRLLEWKNASAGSTAVFVDGARRVGKSFICKQFAQEQYDSHIIIDFGHLPAEVLDIFEHDTANLDLFFLRLSTYYKVTLYERRSAIIFDEVQLYPRARQLVKYLVEDGRYDIIETGSLISLLMRSANILIPSEEEHIEMFPMDFEEFCWARGDKTTIPALRSFFEARQPLGQALLRRVMTDFRIYMLVGGMPQAVQAYVDSNDFAPADKAKRSILNLYRNDISKFARSNEVRVRRIFDAIPSQLMAKEKTYRLSSLSKDARKREYADAFTWLEDAMVVNTCRNAADPGASLISSEDHTTQKLYFGDTGLLVTMCFADRKYADNDLYRALMFDKLNVNEGMFAENIVAQMLRPRHPHLHFYSRSDSQNRANTMEIDFLLSGKRKPYPVEVKTGRYRPHASLDKFMARFGKRLEQPVILYAKDVMETEGILHLPLFMAMFL